MIRRKLENIDPIVVATVMVAIAALVLGLALGSTKANAASGGMSLEPEQPTVAGGKAKLLPNGMAVAPESAPKRVKQVIAAANKIRNKPYVYGGGHGSFKDNGYDCSGAVSFALHGGRYVNSPMPSTGYMRGWGVDGKGKWITTYANGGHMYMVVAGLRWDTSGTGGSGPSWHKDMSSPRGFVARHPQGA